MDDIFFGSAQVSIQGSRVLRLIDFTRNQAKYEVIGFENLPVQIIDSRVEGLRAIQDLLDTKDSLAFAPKFNHPAIVHITKDEANRVVISLSDTSEELPGFILWIAIGLEDSIPVYDYWYENIVPLANEGDFGLIAVYHIPSDDFPAFSSREVSSASSISSLSA